MAKVELTYYLHDDDDGYQMREAIAEAIGRVPDEEFMKKVGRPFYEVAFRCTVDDETGEFTVLSHDI